MDDVAHVCKSLDVLMMEPIACIGWSWGCWVLLGSLSPQDYFLILLHVDTWVLEPTLMVVWWPLDAIWSLACCSLVIMHMKPIRCCKLVVRSLYPSFGVLVLLLWWRYIVEPLDMFLMIWRPWIWWWYSWKSLCSHLIGGVGVLDTLDMMSIWWSPPPCWCEVSGCEDLRIPHAFDDVH